MHASRHPAWAIDIFSRTKIRSMTAKNCAWIIFTAYIPCQIFVDCERGTSSMVRAVCACFGSWDEPSQLQIQPTDGPSIRLTHSNRWGLKFGPAHRENDKFVRRRRADRRLRALFETPLRYLETRGWAPNTTRMADEEKRLLRSAVSVKCTTNDGVIREEILGKTIIPR